MHTLITERRYFAQSLIQAVEVDGAIHYARENCLNGVVTEILAEWNARSRWSPASKPRIASPGKP